MLGLVWGAFERRLTRPGHTFDGRYLFAPAVVRLATHELFESFRPIIGDYRTLSIVQPRWEQTIPIGEIIYVDRFANLISNLTPAHLEEVSSATKRRKLFLRIGDRVVEGLVNSYSEGIEKKSSVLINSDGKLEVILKEAAAADLLQIKK